MKDEGVDLSALSLTAVARDLRAPLVLMRQLSFQIQSDLGPDSVAAEQALKRLRLTAAEALKMTDQLASFGALSQLPLEPVPLNGLCTRVERELRPLGDELGQQLVCELPCRPIIVIGNYDALRSVLVNFLTDALRYNHSDLPVRLRASVGRSRRVHLEIRDHGVGFDLNKSLVQLNYDQGQTVTPVMARPLMSTLNLLMADRLTKLMNGSLSVSKHRSGGVSVIASLPLSRQLSLLELVN